LCTTTCGKAVPGGGKETSVQKKNKKFQTNQNARGSHLDGQLVFALLEHRVRERWRSTHLYLAHTRPRRGLLVLVFVRVLSGFLLHGHAVRCGGAAAGSSRSDLSQSSASPAAAAAAATATFPAAAANAWLGNGGYQDNRDGKRCGNAAS
uniref:Uncharacterized protein n=1 Tax=Anopheles atroparvus TaxID=41427 RepID=A0A182ILB2_ANOAO